MTAARATAEVFYAAFKAMDVKERNAFLGRLFADRRLREDLMDVALAMERMKEPDRPLEEALADLNRGRSKRTR